jgi:dihydrodipicolinate synthase/N-acetylneuraminate lyase
MSGQGGAVRGVFSALVSTFDERRELDLPAMNGLLEYVVAQHVAGVALFTEAAEDVLLSPEERQTLLKLVAEAVSGKKQLVVFVSAASTLEAVELLKSAEAADAAAVVIAPPRLPGVGYRELYRHVDRIVRAASIPVLLADRPGNALSSLEEEELAALVRHVDLAGVFAPHAASEDLSRWRRYLGDPEKVLVSGCSLNLRALKLHGVEGAICALSLLAPAQAEKAWSAHQNDAEGPALEVLRATKPLMQHLGPPNAREDDDAVKRIARKIARRSLSRPELPSTYPAPSLKEALVLQGHSLKSEVRPPYERLKAEQKERLRTILKAGGALS